MRRARAAAPTGGTTILAEPLILALDTSAKSASAAVGTMDSLLGEISINVKITHSQTLLPMLHSLLECAGIAVRDVDCFAVSAGPGSFTGLRIGIGAVKGLAYGLQKPCAAISTLEALSRNLPGVDGIVCAAMDARCGQAYAALFDASPDRTIRRTADQALTLAELEAQLAEVSENGKKNIFLVGDGAQLCYNTFGDRLPGCVLAADNARLQRASGVLLAARDKLCAGDTLSAAALAPVYLRLPQAERERLKKQTENIETGKERT